MTRVHLRDADTFSVLVNLRVDKIMTIISYTMYCHMFAEKDMQFFLGPETDFARSPPLFSSPRWEGTCGKKIWHDCI